MANSSSIKISAGGLFQEHLCLLNLVDDASAKKLNTIANMDGWRVVQPKEAWAMGFFEMVNWARTETNILVLIGDKYLVCLSKDNY